MDTREEAKVLLGKIYSCRPKNLFGKIDESSRGLGFVLAYLCKAEHEVIAGELARELGVSTARIAALLKNMEKNGLIVRQRSSDDARQTVVKITRAGAEFAEELKEQLLSKIELLLEKVGKRDLEEFIRISYKIREALGE